MRGWPVMWSWPSQGDATRSHGIFRGLRAAGGCVPTHVLSAHVTLTVLHGRGLGPRSPWNLAGFLTAVVWNPGGAMLRDPHVCIKYFSCPASLWRWERSPRSWGSPSSEEAPSCLFLLPVATRLTSICVFTQPSSLPSPFVILLQTPVLALAVLLFHCCDRIPEVHNL